MPNATKSEIKDILIKEFDASPADLVAIDKKITAKFSKELENEQTIELVSLLNSAIREERIYA
jgi:nucleoid DNA-binding protein